MFKICLSISVLAHAAFFASYAFKPAMDNPRIKEPVEINYIVIEHPKITDEKEIIGNKQCEAMLKRENIKEKRLQNEKDDKQEPKPENKEFSRNLKTAEEKTLSGKQEAFLKYFNLLREKIRREMDKTLKTENKNTVTLIFTLNPDGKLGEFNFETEGLETSLRSKVTKSLGKAQPFPPFPKELGRDSLNFSLTIQFNPREL